MRALSLSGPVLSLLFVATLLAFPARAADPLVDVAWLKANLEKSGLVVLDVRSGAGLSREAYLQYHIPGAVFTDYRRDGWRGKDAAGVSGQLPPPARLEALIGRLGIGNDTHVVLAPLGQSAADMATATRVYWTFKVLGHDAVSILDGGYAAWLSERTNEGRPVNPLASGGAQPPPRKFKASVRGDMLVTRADVEKAMAAGTPLVDNRPHDYFVGMAKSGAAKRAGTLPGAQSLPEGWLTQGGGGSFWPKEKLAKVYGAAGVPTDGDQISFCNTGQWASLGWFTSHELLGNKAARLYDGSMAEWTSSDTAPVMRKVQID